MKVLKKEFQIPPDIVQEQYYCRATNTTTRERMPDYDSPLYDKIEEELLNQLNDWLKDLKEVQIISFNMSCHIATLKIFYTIPDSV